MQFEQNNTLIPPREALEGTLATPRGYIPVFGKHVPVYPKGDWSTGRKLLSSLGSFWSRHFGSRGELSSLFHGETVQAIQSYIDYLETVACLNRFECPVFHRRVWYALVLKESELNTGRAALLKYGDDGALYDGTNRYGVPVNNSFYEIDLTVVQRLSLITNRIIEPTATWVNGSDFHMEDGALILRDNPFDGSRFAVRNIVDNVGTVIDREVVLWAFDTAEDQSFLYQHYGYAIRHKTSSSQGYKDLINAAWNGYVGGLSTQDLEWLIAAVAGLDTVKETEETVQVILNQETKTVVVTDQHSYIYPAGSVTRYDVGDRVYAGQTLVDTVMVFDLANFDDQVELLTRRFVSNSGQMTVISNETSSSSAAMPAPEYLGHRQASKVLPDTGYAPLLVALPVGKGLLPEGYAGALSFVNERGSYDVSSSDANGRTIGKITTVNGAVADIAKLWADAHAAGVSAGQTWLEKLNTIPAYVNPAGFVIEHFLSNNGVVVYLRYTRFADDAQGLQLLRLIRETLPPEKLVLFLVDVEAGDDNAEATVDHWAPTDLAYVPSDGIAAGDTDPLVFIISKCE